MNLIREAKDIQQLLKSYLQELEKEELIDLLAQDKKPNNGDTEHEEFKTITVKHLAEV